MEVSTLKAVTWLVDESHCTGTQEVSCSTQEALAASDNVVQDGSVAVFRGRCLGGDFERSGGYVVGGSVGLVESSLPDLLPRRLLQHHPEQQLP